MEMHYEELLGRVTDFLKSEAKTETVVGEPFKLGEFTCVPVIKVGLGFGSGGGEGNAPKKGIGQGLGAGGGVGVEPVGFLVTYKDNISFLEAGKAHGLSAAFEKVPDLIEKLVETRRREKEAEMV